MFSLHELQIASKVVTLTGRKGEGEGEKKGGRSRGSGRDLTAQSESENNLFFPLFLVSFYSGKSNLRAINADAVGDSIAMRSEAWYRANSRSLAVSCARASRPAHTRGPLSRRSYQPRDYATFTASVCGRAKFFGEQREQRARRSLLFLRADLFYVSAAGGAQQKADGANRIAEIPELSAPFSTIYRSRIEPKR